MVLVDKEKLLSDWKDETARAIKIIKILKAESTFSNINYGLKREIIILNGIPNVKVTIEEYPVTRFSKEKNEINSEYFRDFNFEDIADEVQVD